MKLNFYLNGEPLDISKYKFSVKKVRGANNVIILCMKKKKRSKVGK